MQHTSEYIVNRFYEAIDVLIEQGVYNSMYHYATANEFDLSGLLRVRKEPWRRKMHLFWITPLIVKHGLNAKWLFGGEGEMYPAIKGKSSQVISA